MFNFYADKEEVDLADYDVLEVVSAKVYQYATTTKG